MKGDPGTTCEECHRALWVQDGPVCEDCLKIQEAKQAKEPEFPKKEPEERKGKPG